MIQQIIEYNREFVKKESYKPYITSKYPDKKTGDSYLYGYPADRTSAGSTWYPEWRC